MTTSLEDLSDVGDLSGASDGDYLGYDDGLWVPVTPPAGNGNGAEWVHNEGTLTYPAGDNGWTYVNNATSDPIEARHFENTQSIPSGDDALIDTINVTSAMVDVGGQAGLEYPVTVGLRLSISGSPVNQTSFFTWYVAVERNGTPADFMMSSVGSGRPRVAMSLKCPAADGDVLKVHAWMQNDDGLDGIDVPVIVAAPVVLGFNVPASSEDGDIMLLWLPTVPGHQQVETSPDGIDMSVTGSTSPGIQYRYQSGANAGQLVENVSTNRVLFGLRLPHGTIGTPSYGAAFQSANTSAGDPILLRAQQFTTYDFWTAQLPVPS